MFDEKEIYASCNNPGGFLALPVGWLYIRCDKGYINVANTDVVDGDLLNYVFEHYDNITQVEFKTPNGTYVIYERD